MRRLKTAATIILLLFLCTAAYSQEPGAAKEQLGSAQEKATAAKEDDRLPIYKEGWQFFLAPYLWVPGVHLNLSHQGKFSGTTVADVPWYDLVPLLFSKAMGVNRIYVLAQRDGIDYNLAFIPVDFHPKRTSEFDTKYMNEEFTMAYNLARSGYKWSKYPPGFVPITPQPASGQQVQP